MKKAMLALCMVVGLVGCGGQDVGSEQAAYKIGNPPPPILPPPVVPKPPAPPSITSFPEIDCPSTTTYQEVQGTSADPLGQFEIKVYDDNNGSLYTGTDIYIVANLVLVNGLWTHDQQATMVVGQRFDFRVAGLYTTGCYNLTPPAWGIMLNDAPTPMYLHDLQVVLNNSTGQVYLRIDTYYYDTYENPAPSVEWTDASYDEGLTWAGGSGQWGIYP